jgi:hypothetical protein
MTKKDVSPSICLFVSSIIKKGVLQLALQLNFLITKDTCNSLYLYNVNANE